MKINNEKVKEILNSSIKKLIDARCDTYNNGIIARLELSDVIGTLQTLVEIIDFEEE